jgi:hypothetical protein
MNIKKATKRRFNKNGKNNFIFRQHGGRKGTATNEITREGEKGREEEKEREREQEREREKSAVLQWTGVGSIVDPIFINHTVYYDRYIPPPRCSAPSPHDAGGRRTLI